MKKNFLLVLLTCISATNTFAQSTPSSVSKAKFNIGFDAALPIGNYSNLYSLGYGGSLKTAVPAMANADFTLSVSYLNFPIKSNVEWLLQQSGINQKSAGFIPLKAGIKLHAGNGFFAEGQLGAAFATTDGGGVAFAFSPGVGYTYRRSADGDGVEMGLRYEGWKKDGDVFSQLALRFAYDFK